MKPASQVDSAFYPPWDGKISISFGLSSLLNADGECSHLGGSEAQADWLGPSGTCVALVK